jgi:sucrose-6-phosphate hydrolase SacC (GH32 family)
MAVALSKSARSGIGTSPQISAESTCIDMCRVGEDKTNGTAFINVNCYSSTNLVEWTYEGALLSQTASGDTGPGRVIERPKVIYNKNTNKYVMWMHIDSSDYGEAKIGVATGDSVCGKYTYLRSERPLGFESRDSGLYVDDDGKSYLLTEDVSFFTPIVHTLC